MDVVLPHPAVVRPLVSPLRGAARCPCCTARAVAIGLDLQSLAATGFGLVRARLRRAHHAATHRWYERFTSLRAWIVYAVLLLVWFVVRNLFGC